MLISLFLHYLDSVRRAGFRAGSAGYTFEGIQAAWRAEHRTGGAGCYAHKATDAQLLVDHHHPLRTYGEGFGGAHLHAGLALVADVHKRQVLGLGDANAGELRVVGLEIQVGTGAFADVTGDAPIRHGFQEFLHYPLL